MVLPLERVLRYDRWLLSAGLALVIIVAWSWLFVGAGMGMSGVEMTRMSFGESALMEMPILSPARWSLRYALVMLLMWWVMMVAMMLPSAAPMILLAAALNRNADPANPPFGNSGAFTFGYLLGWGAFSAVAVIAQWELTRIGLLSDMLVINSRLLAGGIAIGAGVWQLTPFKQSCLRHCRSPVRFLTENRRPGNAGAIRMGLQHSLFCLGCCWFLMLLLFVGGVMNLIWIAGLAAYVWVEKSVRPGGWLSRVAGVGLVLVGIGLMLAKN
jgi:predicted metal-binding membrane protein